MTIHERALESAEKERRANVHTMTYQTYTKNYLRAFLNDPKLVEKVAAAILMTSDNYDVNSSDDKATIVYANAALQTIKDEVGL